MKLDEKYIDKYYVKKEDIIRIIKDYSVPSRFNRYYRNISFFNAKKMIQEIVNLVDEEE